MSKPPAAQVLFTEGDKEAMNPAADNNPTVSPAAGAEPVAEKAAADAADNTETTGTVLQSASRDLVSLQAQLAVEASARRALEVQLSGVKDAVRQLEQKLEELNRVQQPVRRFSADRQIDETALQAAGLAPDYAADLAGRLNQQEMDLLYLRDQALRENWIDTPRYREEVQALRSSGTSLQDELGADAYDRYLYATGQPNRVVVSSVIGSSPGQVAGLQPGDRIVSYNGERIFSPNDLRSATSAGEPDQYVAMQVDRGGQTVEYLLPAGPIGVRLDVDNVEP
jgi:C-terminal processing protease CtpA/Prc